MKYYLMFSENSEFLKWSYDELVDHCIGSLVMSIATGSFRQTFIEQANMMIAWYLYSREK